MSDGAAERAVTGIGSIDEVLCGGLVRDRLYLVEGTPGVGKTTPAMQFLLESARCEIAVLFAFDKKTTH